MDRNFNRMFAFLWWFFVFGFSVCSCTKLQPSALPFLPRDLSSAETTLLTSLSRIVGGTEVATDRYPWIVGLFEGVPSVGQLPVCGGTLIASNLVLTAAHCAGISAVKVGCRDYYDSLEICDTILVQKEIIHPSFVEEPSPVYDFLVLVLETASHFTPIPYISYTSVTNSFLSSLKTGNSESLELIVMGWGTSAYQTGSQSHVLLEAKVDYIPQTQCVQLYKQLGKGLISSSMLCAASTGKDSCQGDSGGPLIITCDKTEDDILVGVVSWGYGCANSVYPGVYARVSVAVEFVQTQIDTYSIPKGYKRATFVNNSVVELTVSCPTEVPTISPTPLSPTTLSPTISHNATPPVQWRCDFGYFNSLDGCDCECGSFDPDCYASNQILYNCPDPVYYFCNNNATCQLKDSQIPTSYPTVFPTILFFDANKDEPSNSTATQTNLVFQTVLIPVMFLALLLTSGFI